jgi:hypothetical protein
MATAVKVKKSVAVALLTEIGFKGVGGLTAAKLLGKLKTVPAKIDEDTEVEDEAAGKLLEQIAEDPEVIDRIEIVEDKPAKGKGKKAPPAKAAKKGKGKKAAKEEDDEEDEDADEEDDEDEDEEDEDDTEEEDEDEDEEEDSAKSKKGKKSKKAKGAKGAKGKKGKPSKEVETDKFGCRVGSQAAAINAAITKKVQKADKIAEASKQKSYRVKSHLAAMVAKGHVKKTDKGYCLA